jgi:hypothetical protein
MPHLHGAVLGLSRLIAAETDSLIITSKHLETTDNFQKSVDAKLEPGC